MQPGTKVQIARTTLSLLTLVASLFLLGVLVLVLCVGLEINPFKETTTSFLIATFVGLIGVAAVLVLLNISVNMSLLADARIAELKIEPRRGFLRCCVIAFFVIAVASVAVGFDGPYLLNAAYLEFVHAH